MIWINQAGNGAGYEYFKLEKGMILMRQRKMCASLAVILALIAAPVLAQQEQHEQHHPGNATGAGMPQGMPGGAMQGAGGMPMSCMMRVMTGQDGMTGMATMMAGHVEGRLAFLKTELKITQAQLPLWNAVADAMRDNTKTMSGMMSGGMPARVDNRHF